MPLLFWGKGTSVMSTFFLLITGMIQHEYKCIIMFMGKINHLHFLNKSIYTGGTYILLPLELFSLDLFCVCIFICWIKILNDLFDWWILFIVCDFLTLWTYSGVSCIYHIHQHHVQYLFLALTILNSVWFPKIIKKIT